MKTSCKLLSWIGVCDAFACVCLCVCVSLCGFVCVGMHVRGQEIDAYMWRGCVCQGTSLEREVRCHHEDIAYPYLLRQRTRPQLHTWKGAGSQRGTRAFDAG